ncbi:hypothetical protein [uncultured Oxalicibacterium sp.]|uniref:hypothetical protein n=1 Tax=uncultured Oxalicibacterium sp. TaxID=1168540 RepID=UPI0025FA27E1|nr:hypothetical protein [uncultured Oxalicibacterium sp.]
MARLEDIVKKYQDGARFVISAPMLRLDAEEFDTLVKVWMQDDNRGFELAEPPHRKVVDGEFFIDRITVIRVST